MSFRKHISVLLLGFVLLLAFGNDAFAQEKEKPLNRILFVFDGSQSMFGRWESGMKIDIAKQLLNELLDSLKNVENLELAFRAYGHQSQFISSTQRDCKDTRLEVPFGGGGVPAIKKALEKIQPKGTTPIAYSLEQSAKDFPPCGNCRNMIILITDGIEECDGDPCAISMALQAKGIVLKPFVIGIGLDLELIDRFKCIGSYFNAKNERSFKDILNVVISQALNPTSVQVNLLDINSNPTETDVNMTFYDAISGQMVYNIIHTMNHRGLPDTLSIDPLTTYRMKVHTVPSVTKDSIQLIPGIHNIIAIDAPQGDLIIKVQGKHDYQNLQAIVRQKDNINTLNVQKIDDKQRYLVGTYDLEILTLPRMIVKGVNIAQSHTTKVEIPQPGMAHIMRQSKGVGDVFLKEGINLTWLYSLDSELTSESIPLQPGTYKVVFRPTGSKRAFYTIEQDFTIFSGKSQLVELK
ncbi:MAG: VWA domain-containing protein [Flavobacteriales bacterium]|nr:VWA domain-containing protein [Flavobacteriales bacterium]